MFVFETVNLSWPLSVSVLFLSPLCSSRFPNISHVFQPVFKLFPQVFIHSAKMDHLRVDLLEKFEWDHLPSRNEVLGRFLFAKTHGQNLTVSKIVEFVAQQTINIWKAHKIPTVGIKEASNKLLQIVKRWFDIDKRRGEKYPKIQKLRADLHSSLGEIFDIFSGGLTGIRDVEIRQFYIDSCSPERIWSHPCRKRPISTVDQQVFLDVLLSDSTEESETEATEEPVFSVFGMRTRSKKETIQAVQSSGSTCSKKLQGKESKKTHQNLEIPQEEQELTINKPFLKELIANKQKQVSDSKSKARLDFLQTKQKKLSKQTESARQKSIQTRFAQHLLRSPDQEREAMHQFSGSSEGSSEEEKPIVGSFQESDEEQPSPKRYRGIKGRFAKKSSLQNVAFLNPLSQTSTNPESLLSQASSRPDSDETYDASPEKDSKRKSLEYEQSVAMDRTGTSNRGASRIAISFDNGTVR